MIIQVTDIFELIWLIAIEKKSSCNMKTRGTGNQTHFLESNTRKSHLILREKIWHFDVRRKLNSPPMGGLPIVPYYLSCNRPFSWFSGHKTSGKRVSKVFEIVNMSRCKNKIQLYSRTTFEYRTWHSWAAEEGQATQKLHRQRNGGALVSARIVRRDEDTGWQLGTVHFQTLGTFSRFSHPLTGRI